MRSLLAVFAFAGALVGQQNSCPPTINGSVIDMPPPWEVVGTFTSLGSTPGSCPDGSCLFDFEFNIEVTLPTPADGQTFQLCLWDGGNIVCFPTSLPPTPGHVPPPHKYTFSQVFNEFAVECNSSLYLELAFNPGLGYITFASLTLLCGYSC